MASKQKIINLYITPSSFSFLFRKSGDYDFSEISGLRSLLSNEKSKLINLIKTKSPNSIYHLAKLAKRDFKSVQQDVQILKKFGIIDLVKQEQGNRKRLKPVLLINKIQINLDFS